MGKNNVISSFIWKLLERASTQIINLIVQIVLARMISPENFGSLSVLVVFINIATIFVQKGLSSALIRKKDADELDFNTAFIASIMVAAVLYVILFICAPLVADFYESPILKSTLRVLALQLIFGALYCIQNAILVRHMKFKLIFIRGLVAAIMSGIVGIAMAIANLGLWALVIQTLTNQILMSLTVLGSIKWRPRLQFSFQRLKNILSFGGIILMSELLSYGVESIRTLAIGKRYSTESLSYYDRGQIYPATIMRSVHDTIGSVMLPVFAKEQDDDKRLLDHLIRTVSMSMFLVIPLFSGLAAVAEPLVRVLLTEKWLPAVPFLMLFSFYQLPYPIQGICRQALYAKGESRMVLRMEIIKSLITLVTMVISFFFDIIAVVVAAIITMYLVTFINIYFTKKIIPLSVKAILKAILPSLICGILMFMVVFLVGLITINVYLKLVLQIIIGVIVYIGLCVLTHNKNLYDCKRWLLSILAKNDKKTEDG